MKKKLLQIITALVINFILAWPLSYAVSISNINQGVTSDSALITWQTDEHANTEVYFGENKDLHNIRRNQTSVKEHSVKLSNLVFKTLYYYRVKSCYESECDTSELLNFTTENIPPPEKITGLVNTSVTTTTISLRWSGSASPYLKHYLVYRDNEVVGNITINSFTDSDLTALTTYNYEVGAVDSGGNVGEKSDSAEVTTAEPDLTAPEINDVVIAALTSDSATITWVTDEDSNSTIYYGETSALENEQGLKIYTKHHTIQISGLINGTLYYYNVESCDISGNCGLSTISEFVPGMDITVPVIDVYLPEYHNKKKIKITGKTKPYSEVKFYVNGIYRGILGKSVTGADGNIDIEVTGLEEGNNTIKITAVDSYNLKNEKEINVVVDTKPPEYTISSIPRLSKERNLIIDGTVNEPCTITFYSQLVSEGIQEKKIENFHSDYERLTPNAVTLVWDEVEEVDYYAIYRDDVGLIGMPTKPPFTDMYANTSTTYTYEITAVYRDCSSGSKESISVTTLDGGNVNIRKPILLQTRCGGITPLGQITTQDYFTYSLGLNPGMNEVIINISDKAGNSILIKNKTIHDNSPPQIIYSNLDRLSPSYTKEVTIEGKVSEHAIVYVYIDEEEEASYIAETDEEGEFSVKINLRRKVGGEYEVRPVSVNVRGESLPIWENDIKIIAIDAVGLESNAVTSSIAYQLCGYGGDWNIEIGEVAPDILIPRLLLQGVARIGFDVNFKWQGPGDNKDATITERPRITLRPLNKIDQERFDEEFFGHVWEKHSNYYRSSYFLIDLRKPYMKHNLTTLEQENNLSEHNLGKCLVPLLGCVKLPMMLEIHYSYKEPYGTTVTGTRGEEYSPLARREAEAGIVHGIQRQCFDVQIAIDRRLPTDKLLPKTLLESMVKGIEHTIKGIDAVLEPVNLAKKFVFIGCLGSWVVWLVFKFKEWVACKAGMIFEGFNSNTCDPDETDEKGAACASCLRAKGETIKAWEKIGWVCDRVICPAAPTIQKYVRDVKREETRQDTLGIPPDLQQKSHCEEEEIPAIEFERTRKDEIDKKYRKVDEYLLEVRNVDKGVAGHSEEEYCESEYIKNYDSVAIFMNELKESKCLADPEAEGCGGIGTVPRLLRGVCEASESEGPKLISSEGQTYLITDRRRGFPPTSEEGKVRAAYEVTQKTLIDLKIGEVKDNDYFEVESTYFIQRFGKEFGIKEEYKGQKVFVRPEREIMTENDCYVGMKKDDPNREYIEYDDLIDFDRRKEIGIYDDQGKLRNPEVWDIKNFKPQFCGISKEDVIKELKDDDKVRIDGVDYEKEGDKWSSINLDPKKEFDDKGLLEETQKADSSVLTRGDDTYTFLRDVSGFITSKKERRKECTNIPRAVWEEVCGGDAKDYVIDPTGDLISAFQSGCLTAISSYLTQYKTMLEMIKHCFEQILYTGEGSSGVCKQFLSIYLCDLIYYAIRCIVEKAGRGYGKPRIQGGVLGFINYLRDGGSNIQNSIRGRYGTSTIYRTMFVERKLIHSACALAFTGDYDLDLDAMIDAQVAIPIKTMCYINGNRRFAYADPQTGRATFIYNLGVFIVSGGSAGTLTTGYGGGITTSTTDVTRPLIKPIRYRVQLICSNTNNCRSDISETGACDCLTYGGEQSRRGAQGEIPWNIPVGDGTLEQGETLNEEVYYDRAINTPYRFDRARILISYVDNQGVEHIDEVCGETYLEGVGAKPPTMCKFDITQGFICEFEWGEFVTAYFDRVQIKRKRETPREEERRREDLFVEDRIELEGYIRKEGSTQKMEEQKVYLRYRLYGGYEDLIPFTYREVTKRNTDLETDFRVGNYAFPGIKIVDSGPVYNEDTNEVNPFASSVSRNLALSYDKKEYFRVDADPPVDYIRMIDEIRISFTKEGDGFRYKIINGNCEGIDEGMYNDELICITPNRRVEGEKVRLIITGTPPRGSVTLTINSEYIGPAGSRDKRHIYLEISLHAANEYNEMERTPLTYNRDIQRKTFDFWVYKEARKEEEKPEEDEEIKKCRNRIIEIAKIAEGAPECFGAVEWTTLGEPNKPDEKGRCYSKNKELWPKCEILCEEGVCSSLYDREYQIECNKEKGCMCPLDCSTFTLWVYNTYMYGTDNEKAKKGWLATNQANNIGRPVEGADPSGNACGNSFEEFKEKKLQKELNIDNLKKGDFLFFCYTKQDKTYTKVSHAAIYYGDGEIIHVSSSEKEVATTLIGSLENKYAGARRICPNEK